MELCFIVGAQGRLEKAGRIPDCNPAPSKKNLLQLPVCLGKRLAGLGALDLFTLQIPIFPRP